MNVIQERAAAINRARATAKPLSGLPDAGAADKHAEQNGGEYGECQKFVRWRAVEPTKLLVQQCLIAPNDRGRLSNQGGHHCAGHLSKNWSIIL